MEVFDTNCFCSNQQQPLGDAVMRIQLLNACGWQVCVEKCGRNSSACHGLEASH